MISLIDADSIAHKAYHIVKDLELSEDEKIIEALLKIEGMEASMFNEFEDEMGVYISHFVYFFTTCKNNFRKEIAETYKANRPEKDELVFRILDAYICFHEEHSTVYKSDTLEADDLIPKFIRENGLKTNEYCIFNLDKDLDQLEGFHFNYQRVVLRDENNEVMLSNDGEKIMRYKGLKYITRKEAFYNFCTLILVGDSSDNISGVKGVGIKGAEKLLTGKTIFGMWRQVVEQYLTKESKDKLKMNVKLMRLR